MCNDYESMKEDIIKTTEDLAEPINYTELINEGILEKKGNRYRIIKPKEIPEHVRKKIKKIDSDGFVLFVDSNKFQKLLNKIK